MKTYFYTLAQAITEQELNIPRTDLTQSSVATVLRIVFAVAGAVALIFVTLGGLQYVTSRGDPQGTAKAKNTIIYALIGLVVCIVAYNIVIFVVERV